MKNGANKHLTFVLSLTAVLVTSATAFGQGQMVMGGRLGFTDIEDVDSAPTVGGQLDYFFSPDVSVLSTVDYALTSKEGVDVSILSLAGTMKYTARMATMPFRPFGLVGMGYHRLSLKFGGTSTSDSDIAIELGGGGAYAINKELELSGELRLRKYESVDLLAITAGVSRKM